MYHYRSTRRNDRSGHRSNSRTNGKRSTRARRFGGLLLAAAITLIATGMGTGQGLVLAVGLLFAPFGLHLFADDPAPPDQVHTIIPNHATHPGSPHRRASRLQARRHPRRPGRPRPRGRSGAGRIRRGLGPRLSIARRTSAPQRSRRIRCSAARTAGPTLI
jgi:hypothetical protein